MAEPEIAEQQPPSGTPFDPAPQFRVDDVDLEERTVVGRCWFGPLRRGLTFDCVATQADGSWEEQPTRLVVTEIWAYEQAVEAIDATWTARLTLDGAVPEIERDAVLVSTSESVDDWVLVPDPETDGQQVWARYES